MKDFLSDYFKNHITTIKDFPKPGVLFFDISPMMSDRSLFSKACDQMLLMVRQDFDYVAGIESRGFIFGAAMAATTRKGFIPIRKKGKLPPIDLVSEAYSLEYGKAEIEMSKRRGKVLIVDDVLATGGTMLAAQRLCKKAGLEVIDICTFVNLSYLNNFNVKAVVHY